MYLSCLLINTGDNIDKPRPGRLWLRNRYHVHQRLCMAFPSASRKANDAEFLSPFKPNEFGNGQIKVKRAAEAGFLFRIDPLIENRVMIIIQSAVKPDWDYAFHNAKYFLAAPPEVKPFEPRFSKGQCLRFRLAANPTRRLSKYSPDAKEESIGKRVPVPTDRILEWFVRRAESAGFSIEAPPPTVQPEYIYMSINGEGQRLRSVRFDGLLRVTDADAFRQTLIRGIGSGKAFGFGLLSVAPASTMGSGEAT